MNHKQELLGSLWVDFNIQLKKLSGLRLRVLGLGLGFREAAEHAMEHWGMPIPCRSVDLNKCTSARVGYARSWRLG